MSTIVCLDRPRASRASRRLGHVAIAILRDRDRTEGTTRLCERLGIDKRTLATALRGEGLTHAVAGYLHCFGARLPASDF